MQLIDLDPFQSVSIDTRTLKQGDLFIALHGPNFDGHNFVNEVAQKGAIAAVVEKGVSTAIPLIKVTDSFQSFCDLAKARRQEVDIPILALTGSCGKTTTKTMLVAILSLCGNVLATEKNNNNNIGVPLTLLKLMPEHDFAVLEIGANQKHEISFAANIVTPDVALITNVAPVHIEGFGDLDGVAKVKGDILCAMADDGIGILNADDNYFSYWGRLLGGREHLSFGRRNYADVVAHDVEISSNGTSTFTLCTPDGEDRVSLRLLGEHNVMNALAAAAVATAIEVPFELIKQGLEVSQPVPKRMVKKIGKNGVIIIDDSYNANPSSMLAAMRVLMQNQGERIMVVGDMGELGSDADEYHRQLGIQAKELGVNSLYAQGELTQLTVESFGAGGQFFTDRQELIALLAKKSHAGVTILVKGSKVNRLWEVVTGLMGE